VLYLTSNFDTQNNYQLIINKGTDGGVLRLSRGGTLINQWAFPLPPHADLIVERRGSYLLLKFREVPPMGSLENSDDAHDTLLGSYCDQDVPRIVQAGFLVTTPLLSAGSVDVQSDAITEFFEEAPTNW
jgi:hypothetical protein